MTDTTKQPYESWKGAPGSYPVWKNIVPSNSQPSTNGVSANPEDYQSAFGSARPLKVWRKQLIPPKPTKSSAKPSGRILDMPGGSVSVAQANDCPDCATSQNVANVNMLINGNFAYLTTATPNDLFSNAETLTDPANNIYEKCISCDPVSNIIKSGVTLLNKNYYTTTKAKLQARCQLYDQKSTPERRAGIQYFNADGTPAWPSDSVTGSQIFNTPNCPVGCPGSSTVSTIYKPSNVNFGVQGAVDSSTRLMRLKQNTMNKNGASFASAYGQAAANAGKYGTIVSPYFIKSKVNICYRDIYHRNGNKTMCFTTS